MPTPMNAKQLASLKKSLWSSESARPVNLYGVLDCARGAATYSVVQRCYLEKSCLFAGALDPALERVAPHLMELSARDSITDTLFLEGWQHAWGIVLQTETSFKNLRRHLRTFLRVKDPRGRFLLFRYYDPRVLAAYLPTCNAEELGLIFGTAISRIILPSENGGFKAFRFHAGKLDANEVLLD